MFSFFLLPFLPASLSFSFFYVHKQSNIWQFPCHLSGCLWWPWHERLQLSPPTVQRLQGPHLELSGPHSITPENTRHLFYHLGHKIRLELSEKKNILGVFSFFIYFTYVQPSIKNTLGSLDQKKFWAAHTIYPHQPMPMALCRGWEAEASFLCCIGSPTFLYTNWIPVDPKIILLRKAVVSDTCDG